jgi:hypothetical protein
MNLLSTAGWSICGSWLLKQILFALVVLNYRLLG